MWSLIVSFLTRNLLGMLGWLAIGAAVLAVLLGAKRAGRNAERVERMQRNVEVQREQLKEAARRPRTRDELAERVRSDDF